jgi:hypothetical protein
MKTVAFRIPALAFSVINNRNERETIPGEFEISAGGRQPQGDGVKDVGISKTRIRIN